MNDTNRTVLVIGGTSDIGRAVALAYAAAGWNVVLAARNGEGARRNADDIVTRHGVDAEVRRLDVLDIDAFKGFVDGLSSLPQTVVCVVGDLGDQERAEGDPAFAAQVMRANFEGPVLLLGVLAERFAERGSGLIVGVGSVAGDRGRASNYVYGAAKAGFGAFLSGLRNRLATTGVRVVTVKPGFVRTRMTEGMKLPGALTADPEAVARRIHAAETGRADVIYVKPVWRLVMTVIAMIPEPIFKRLKL